MCQYHVLCFIVCFCIHSLYGCDIKFYQSLSSLIIVHCSVSCDRFTLLDYVPYSLNCAFHLVGSISAGKAVKHLHNCAQISHIFKQYACDFKFYYKVCFSDTEACQGLHLFSLYM